MMKAKCERGEARTKVMEQRAKTEIFYSFDLTQDVLRAFASTMCVCDQYAVLGSAAKDKSSPLSLVLWAL